MSEQVYFADFEVDLETGEIRKQGVRVRLRGKPCQILAILLTHPGEIVTRQQIIEALWPADTFVDFDANLKTALSHLRRVLGDSAESPRFVQTIQGIGYRFLPAVSKIRPLGNDHLTAFENRSVSSELPISHFTGPAAPKLLRSTDASLDESAWRRIVAACALMLIAGVYISIALRGQPSSASNGDRYDRVMLVVPFENLNGDASTDDLTDGITKEMTAALQFQLSGKVAVVAGNAALPYKHTHKSLDIISKELGGVDFVLQGTVRQSRDTIDINAELFRVSDHKSIWSGTFEHKLADIQSFQRDIATHILESISVEIIQAESPSLRSRYRPGPRADDSGHSL